MPIRYEAFDNAAADDEEEEDVALRQMTIE